jgi:hypothetical protein
MAYVFGRHAESTRNPLKSNEILLRVGLFAHAAQGGGGGRALCACGFAFTSNVSR